MATQTATKTVERYVEDTWAGAELQCVEAHCGTHRITLLANALDDAIIGDFDDMGYEIVGVDPTRHQQLKIMIMPTA